MLLHAQPHTFPPNLSMLHFPLSDLAICHPSLPMLSNEKAIAKLGDLDGQGRCVGVAPNMSVRPPFGDIGYHVDSSQPYHRLRY
jgi:hypothetical protein